MDYLNKVDNRPRPIPGYATSSLVAPWDIDKEKVKQFYDVNIPPMSNEEFEIAFKTLYINDTEKFDAINKRHIDPHIPLQKYYLLSFVPCRGARPDKTGTYGFIKMRGAFETDEECQEKSAELIKNGDSYHPIRVSYVGRPTPVNINPNFCKTVTSIDISKQIDREISSNVKAKRDAEKKEIETIQNRAKNLQENTDFESSDPFEQYITLRNKKAQLIWTYTEHSKKKEEIKNLIIKAFSDIKEYDEKYPEMTDKYLDKFMEARKSAGIKDDFAGDSFMKYMVEDRIDELDFEIPK